VRVLTHSAELQAGQSRGLDQALAKAGRELDAIGDTLARGRARRSRAQLETAIDKITNRQYVRDVLTWTLTGDARRTSAWTAGWTKPPATPWKTASSASGSSSLTATTGPSARSWPATGPNPRPSSASASSKDPHVISFSPMHHHTDAQIRVHVFCCVIALITAHLMRRQAAHAGLQLSVRALLDALAGIQQTVLLYPGARGRPKARHMITDMEDTQQTLFEIDLRAPPLGTRQLGNHHT